MLYFITGKPGSGKSEIAEDIAVKSGCKTLYYIATMKIMDEEGIARRNRHQKKRLGKGFITIELECDIEKVSEMTEDNRSSCLLIECMANLVGNEMHEGTQLMKICRDPDLGMEKFTEEICDQILYLSMAYRQVIVVSSEYDPDDSDDDDTKLYKRLLHSVNEKMKKMSDSVYDTSDER